MLKLIQRLYNLKFFKFGVVGGLGTIVNLTIFFLFSDLLKINEVFIAIVAFIIAATHNYILNHIWTFKDVTKEERISLSGWGKFILSSLIGLTINLIVLKIIIYLFNPKFKVIAQGFGILSGMIVNFLLAKFFVFKNK